MLLNELKGSQQRVTDHFGTGGAVTFESYLANLHSLEGNCE
jgi:hypothetical protein